MEIKEVNSWDFFSSLKSLFSADVSTDDVVATT